MVLHQCTTIDQEQALVQTNGFFTTKAEAGVYQETTVIEEVKAILGQVKIILKQ